MVLPGSDVDGSGHLEGDFLTEVKTDHEKQRDWCANQFLVV